jgi:hypothetical protein
MLDYLFVQTSSFLFSSGLLIEGIFSAGTA